MLTENIEDIIEINNDAQETVVSKNLVVLENPSHKNINIKIIKSNLECTIITES